MPRGNKEKGALVGVLKPEKGGSLGSKESQACMGKTHKMWDEKISSVRRPDTRG